MKASRVLRPKQPRNFVATAVVCVLAISAYLVASRLSPWSPKRGLGLALGIMAALLFVFEMAYPFRRPRARPLFTAKNWLQAHVYLGVLAAVAVVLHAGMRWPGGGMGWALFLLSLWTTATGLLGVWLQKWIPVALADGLQVEAIYERIPALMQQLLAEADTLMADADDVLERFYRTEVRGPLSRPAPSWSFLLDVRTGRDRALEPFRRIGRFVSPEGRSKVDDLMSIYTEKIELDAHLSLQRVLRRWLVLHVPTAGLLMGLVGIHVLAWAWY